MITKKSAKYQELVTKLREIFQIDRPELDFGIYRILNARAGEIDDYLSNRLAEKVKAALANGNDEQKEQIRKELNEKEAQYRNDGINPDSVPKILELRQKLAQLSSGEAEHENAVFSHLLTFFSRYYDNGDFISQRRYKGDTYAIPYAGEEVMLHWANKDQYYTKSGENFANYSFKLEDGRKVHCRLIAADTAKDNRKDNDKDRRFALIEHQVVSRVDEQGEEYEEELFPVLELDGADGNELVLYFEYKAVAKGVKQEALVNKAVETILKNDVVKSRWLGLSKREPTDKNPQRTLLEKHLVDYTTKNTADYFIHKDLGGFLRRELDFYIKNEVMHLDDVQNAEAFADIEKSLRMIQCLRCIALELVNFLAQLENFQKKLWTKKKFITSTEYCISLGLLSEKLKLEVISSEEQVSEWIHLGLIDSREIITKKTDFIDFLMVDTRFFNNCFKQKLIAEINDIDESVTALLIHSDNYQALNLLRAKYEGKVDCIHINPPYNTSISGFLYKNNYRHSSWLSLMHDRISIGAKLLNESGDFLCHIDENEYERLDILFDLNGLNDHGTIIWDKKNPMLGRKGVATQHEYISFRSKDERIVNAKSQIISTMFLKLEELKGKYKNDLNLIQDEYTKWLGKQKDFSGGDLAYKYISADFRIYRLVAMGAPEKREDSKYHIPLVHPISNQPCPVPPNGWSRAPETLQDLITDGLIVFGKDHSTQPQKIVYLRPDGQKQATSLISDGKSGKSYLDSMGLEFPYCHPVSLYEQLLSIKTEPSLFIDFFAGSGTNGHAVINLTRQLKVKHRQILVEVGDHFNNVMLPRMKKVSFAGEWNKGRPIDGSGSPQLFKVMHLESYEDTLNNLQLQRTTMQGDLLSELEPETQEDYLVNYMLDVESRGSLLSVNDFKKPFDYEMNIAVDSAGAYERQKIDLVETFNYLIGLTVKTIDAHPERGFTTVTGTLPSGESCLVLWRDCDLLDYDGITKLCDTLHINPADNEFDVVYINGDHNIPTVLLISNTGGLAMPVRLSIDQFGFNTQFRISDWHEGLIVSTYNSEDSETIIPAPPYLNLEYLCSLPEGESWYSTIPHYWIERVSPFSDHQLRLLSLISRSVGCQQVMNSPYRLILYLAVHYFPFNDRRIIDAAEYGVANLLDCMELSSTHEALEFIERVDISVSVHITEIQLLLSNKHKQYQCFSAYPVITKSTLQLNRRYPQTTNTTLAVWLSRWDKDKLPMYVTDLLDDVADLVRQKAIPGGGWRRFLSLTSFHEIETKLARYKTLQRYWSTNKWCTLKKSGSESDDDLPEFDSLVVIKKPRTLLRYCLLLQRPELEPECWDLFLAALNKEAVLYQLPKPHLGVLALQIFRNSERKIKGLRFLCAKPKYHNTISFNVFDDVVNGFESFQSKTSIKIDYGHPWF